MELIAALLSGYLIGSLPTAFIVARFVKGIDIRTVGSGNVGGSNVWLHAGKLPSVTTLLFDLVKGALVVAVLRANGFALETQLAAGVAAIGGHNWPVWLRFVGGRGIATTGGVLFLFGPLETLITGVLLAVGAVGVKQGALTTLLVFAWWSLMAWWFGRPPPVIITSVIVWLLIVARRPYGSPDIKKVVAGENVYWNRLWLDREIRDEEEWVKQKGIKEIRRLRESSF